MILDNIPTSSASCDCTILTSKSGRVNLAIAQTTVTVNFTYGTADYVFDYVYVENIVDISPPPFIGIGWTCTTRTATGFTLRLDVSPNTVNYVLRWKISPSLEPI